MIALVSSCILFFIFQNSDKLITFFTITIKLPFFKIFCIKEHDLFTVHAEQDARLVYDPQGGRLLIQIMA